MRAEYFLWAAIAFLWIAEDRLTAERRRRADKERTLLRRVDELEDELGGLRDRLERPKAEGPRPLEPSA